MKLSSQSTVSTQVFQKPWQKTLVSSFFYNNVYLESLVPTHSRSLRFSGVRDIGDMIVMVPIFVLAFGVVGIVATVTKPITLMKEASIAKTLDREFLTCRTDEEKVAFIAKQIQQKGTFGDLVWGQLKWAVKTIPQLNQDRDKANLIYQAMQKATMYFVHRSIKKQLVVAAKSITQPELQRQLVGLMACHQKQEGLFSSDLEIQRYHSLETEFLRTLKALG